jgi:hypothetical protein
MPQRKLIKDILFLRSTKMVLGGFENNLHRYCFRTKSFTLGQHEKNVAKDQNKKKDFFTNTMGGILRFLS